MSDDQTPIEGKGEEMVPNRGLPFDEVGSEEPAIDQPIAEESVEEFVPEESVSYSEGGTPEREINSDEWFNAADELEADVDEIFKDGEDEQPETDHGSILASELPATADAMESVLGIEEIRGHEIELSEDFHTTAPDFDGDADMDFVAARVPVELSGEDQEIILSESGLNGIPEEIASGEEAFVPVTQPEMVSEISDVITDSASPSESVVAEAEFSAETTTIQESPAMTTIKTEKIEGKRLFSDSSLELPGPVSGNAEEKAPETFAGLKATKKLLDLLVPNKRIEQLWERADQLQLQIFEEINDLHLARALLEQIRSAKNLILADKENYEEAERAINEVEYRIAYGKRFKKWGALGYLLLVYEVIWGVAAVITMGLLLGVGIDGLNLSVPGLLSNSEIFIGVFASLFGALGGVAGALFALWRYITEQKFNPQFSIWYITQPIIGLTIGSVIYIILKVGLSLTTGSVSTEIGSFFLPCLLAYLAGFQQNVFLDLAKQILKQIKVGKDEKDNQPGSNADE